MFGYRSSPLTAYKKASTDIALETASPHQLILMLFDGALSAIVLAKANMLAGKPEAKGLAISKAIDIIANGLKVSLEVEAGGELAQNLIALYDYMVKRLVHANLKNQPVALDEVSSLIREIRSAWVEITPAKEETVATAAA
jgi:flagellar protein FliS